MGFPTFTQRHGFIIFFYKNQRRKPQRIWKVSPDVPKFCGFHVIYTKDIQICFELIHSDITLEQNK